jgi:hypothetical protein
MADNEELKKEETQKDEPIVLSIIFTPDGKVSVNGPIMERVLCYGLLEIAKEIIYDFKNSQKIDLKISQENNLINFLRNRR